MRYRPLVLLVTIAAGLAAQQPSPVDRSGLDLTEIRRLPVLAAGRYKPLDSYARELVTAVTGDAKPKLVMATGQDKKRVDPVLLYLDWVFDPAFSRSVSQIAAPNAGSRKLFAPDRAETDTLFKYDELADNPAFEAAIAAARSKDQAEWNDAERELMFIRSRFLEVGEAAGLSDSWKGVPAEARGGPPMIPPRLGRVPGVEYSWSVIASLSVFGHPEPANAAVRKAWTDLRASFLVADPAAFTAASLAIREAIAGLGAPEYPELATLDREVRYNLVDPFSKAAWFYMLTAFLAIIWVVWKKPWFGIVAVTPALVGLAYHVYGSIERTALSGQALIGNLFESLLFVAGGAMVVGIVFELIFRARWILLASSLLAFVATRAALDNPLFMPPSIARLRPVLINNFWIHIHVPTMMLSYATLGLAAVVAHVWLIMRLFKKADDPEVKALAKFTYWIIPPGVILLFAGIILGGIWADASWGRFWGWDPKETWAFITWLIFVVVIHGRWTGWLRDFGTAVGGVIGGLSLLMTYYGVNFFLSGLHSYAGASTDTVSFPGWLVGWLAFEAALLTGSIVRHKMDERGAERDQDAYGPTPAPASIDAVKSPTG